MAVYPYAAPFLSIDTDPDPADAVILGPVHEVTWGRGVNFRKLEVRGMAQATKQGEASTAKFTVLASHDGQFWWDLQLTFEMDANSAFKSQTGPTLKGIRYIRGKVTTTGGPVVAAKALMCASHPFRLRQVV